MDSYGFRGVIYTIKDLVGQDQFMTLDQLKACYDDGWDISTHSQVDLTKLETPEAVRYELLKNRDYLLKNTLTKRRVCCIICIV
jgi:hypothetical protein